MKKRMNLTRMDHEGCRGWWVRIQRGDKQVSKLFSDGVYGSKRKAEAAAISFRDAQLKKLPERVYRGSKGPRLNAAGYYLRTRMRRGKEEKAWVAIWTEDGRQLEKSFSINQHGNAGAKKLAKEYRQTMVKNLLVGGTAQEDVTKSAKKKTASLKASVKSTIRSSKKKVAKKATVKKASVKKASVKKASVNKGGKRSAKKKATSKR